MICKRKFLRRIMIRIMRGAQLGKKYRKLFFLVFFVFIAAKITTLLLPFSESKFSKENNKLPSFNSVKPKLKKYQSPEFRIELKNLNISYFYYGYGDHECNENNILIATLSRPNAFNLRMAVRNSWKKDIPPSITHKFFIGSVSNETLRGKLQGESLDFGDIVFMKLTDSYLNLTFKMNTLFQWQQYYCPKVKYFLRADEDTVLDVSRLQYWIDKRFNAISKNLNEMVIFGHVNKSVETVRDPHAKWYVPYEAYNQIYYPDFVIGASYLITSKAIQIILKKAKNFKHITVDDAFYTGIVAEAAGIKRINSTKHFAFGNPLNQSKFECNENGRPLLFSIFDENGEIETVQSGYVLALEKLKKITCIRSSSKYYFDTFKFFI